MNKTINDIIVSGFDPLLVNTPEINHIKIKIIKDRQYDVPDMFIPTINDEVIINLILDYESESDSYKTLDTERKFIEFLKKTASQVSNFKHLVLFLLDINDDAIKWLWVYDAAKITKACKSCVPHITRKHAMSICKEYLLHNEIVPIHTLYLILYVKYGRCWYIRSLKRMIDAVSEIYYECRTSCGMGGNVLDNLYPSLYHLFPGQADRLYAETKGIGLVNHWTNGGSWAPSELLAEYIPQYLVTKLYHSPTKKIHQNVITAISKYQNDIRWFDYTTTQQFIVDLAVYNANNIDAITWILPKADYNKICDAILEKTSKTIPPDTIKQYDEFKRRQTFCAINEHELLCLIQKNVWGGIPETMINANILEMAFVSYDKHNLIRLFIDNPQLYGTSMDTVTYACQNFNKYFAGISRMLLDALLSEEVFKTLTPENASQILAGRDLLLVYERYPWIIKYVPVSLITPVIIKEATFKNIEVLKYAPVSRIPGDLVQMVLPKHRHIQFDYNGRTNIDIVGLASAKFLIDSMLRYGLGYGYIFDCFMPVYRNYIVRCILSFMDKSYN